MRVLWLFLPHFAPPVAEVVEAAAEDGDEQDCPCGAFQLPRSLCSLDLRFALLDSLIDQILHLPLAALLPVLLLFNLFLVIMLDIVGIPSLLLLFLQLLDVGVNLLGYIFQNFKLIFSQVIDLCCHALHQDVIIFNFLFLLRGSHLLLILRNSILDELLKLLILGEVEVPLALHHIRNALVIRIRQNVLDVTIDNLETEGEIAAIDISSVFAFNMGYFWHTTSEASLVLIN